MARAASSAGGEHAGRDAELVHHAEELVDADACAAVAAEVARDVRVLGLSEEARRGFGRDEVDPDIEDVHRVPTLVSAHRRRIPTAPDEEHAMEIALPAKLENFVHAQVRAGRYVDAQEVVRDAVRRMQEADAPDANLVREAMNLASQAQRDVLGLLQRADQEQDLLHQVLGAASHAVDTFARRRPQGAGRSRVRTGRARLARSGDDAWPSSASWKPSR